MGDNWCRLAYLIVTDHALSLYLSTIKATKRNQQEYKDIPFDYYAYQTTLDSH